MRVSQHTANDLASATAASVARRLRHAVTTRGRAFVAFSGGRTPTSMLDCLADQRVPWQHVHVLQTDERVAPAGDPARNLRLLTDHLVGRVDLPARNLHPIPVEVDAPEAAADAYAALLQEQCGGVLDIVHLGLGEDGHTASLFPGDPVVQVEDRDVAVTRPHDGWRRVTLTRPAIDRARWRCWLVAGPRKRPALRRFIAGDRDIPSGQIRRDASELFTDLDLRRSQTERR